MAFLIWNERHAFSGDGVLKDGGLWASYPRYRVTFEKFQLVEGRNAVFTFRGMPQERMALELHLPGHETNTQKQADLEHLRRAGAELRVNIVNDRGEFFAQANDLLTNWVVAQSIDRHYLWHQKLRELQFDRRRTYRMTVELQSFPPGANLLTVIPSFEGGGYEVP